MSNNEEQRYLRFPLQYRLEHWVFMLTFTILAITGLVQKYAASSISKSIIGMLGGIENTRSIHHIFATLMMVEVVYHLGILLFRLYVKRYRPVMLPSFFDVQAGIQAVLYNLGLRKTRPQQGRYTFEEKMEYWAVVWGMIIMVITGFMMWNPIATAKLLPGQFIPAAKSAHGNEALLAVLAIILWHMYNVVVRHFNRSMFTGYMNQEEMLEEHPLELANIKAGVEKQPANPLVESKRRKVFLPAYGVAAAVMLVGIYTFVTFEQTALATRPPAEQVVVFAPLTPTPLPTLPPTPVQAAQPTAAPGAGNVSMTWEGGISSIFQQKCSTCHGSSAQMKGLNLSNYQSALTGGDSGPGIVPGKIDQSQVFIMQSAGNHPGQLSADELATIKAWIEAGAPEK